MSPPAAHALCTNVVLFSVWWAANNAFAIDCELFFRRFASPLHTLDLVLAQTVVGLLFVSLLHALVQPRSTATSTAQPLDLSLSRLTGARAFIPSAIGTMHCVGSILTALSYSRIGAASTLMWKLTEPLSAIVFKYLLLGLATSSTTTCSVLVVLAGVVMFSSEGFRIDSYAPIISSNLLFPLRNALLKLNKPTTTTDETHEQRFADMHLFGLPLALSAAIIRICIARPTPGILLYLLRNALYFNIYQYTSVTLLSRLDTLSHSILNTFKRFTGIVISMMVLGKHVLPHQVFGIFVAFSGFVMYVVSSRSGHFLLRSFAKIRRHSLVVPVSLFMAFVVFFSSASISQSLYDATSVLEETFRTNGVPSLVLDADAAARLKAVRLAQVNGTETNREPVIMPRVAQESKPGPLQHVLVQPYLPQNFTMHGYNQSENIPDNVGNMIWRYGAHTRVVQFPIANVHTCHNDGECFAILDAQPTNSTIFHFPRANSMSETNMHQPLEKIRKYASHPSISRVIVNGIGIQVEFESSVHIDKHTSIKEISASVQELPFSDEMLVTLLELSKLPVAIMTRGDYTMKVLHRGGFQDAISTGCPSFWINKDVHLGRSLETKYHSLKGRVNDSTLKVAVPVKSFENYQSVLSKIAEKYPGALFYAQTEWDMKSLSANGIPFDRVRIFSSVDEWMDSLAKMDVAIGGRIHGNMAAIAAGIPVIVVTVDYRILEMVQRMRIPYITVDELADVSDFDVATIAREKEFDGRSFDDNRCLIAKEYRRIYRAVDLEVQSHVKAVSEIC